MQENTRVCFTNSKNNLQTAAIERNIRAISSTYLSVRRSGWR
ncbi:hypothetical protein [Synechocystis sp. PCC 7509]|nr:hypothetical protein [Synechocystis sp. PCC 7509]